MTVDLDDLFAQAAAQVLQPDAALVSRVLADAAALQPVQIVAAQGLRRNLSPQRVLWTTLCAVFGGGPALAAVGSAALVGLFFGVAQPASLTAFAGEFVMQAPLDSVELIPAFDTLLTGE